MIAKTTAAISGDTKARVDLPPATPGSGLAVEDALRLRESVRSFTDTPIGLDRVSQLLWAAQGITHGDGFRTAPSAGALYPLETYVVSGAVDGLAPGVYRYDPQRHGLQAVVAGDHRPSLCEAALAQDWMAEAATILLLGAVPRRTTAKYGERGHRYVHMEVGHAAQNVYLQAQALGLGTTMVGAFRDDEVRSVLNLPQEVEPLCLLPIGTPR